MTNKQIERVIKNAKSAKVDWLSSISALVNGIKIVKDTNAEWYCETCNSYNCEHVIAVKLSDYEINIRYSLGWSL